MIAHKLDVTEQSSPKQR